MVRLYDGAGIFVTYYISHLVLEAFVGPRPEGLVAAHWDDKGWNNEVGNLYWATHEENYVDSLFNRNPHVSKSSDPDQVFAQKLLDGLKSASTGRSEDEVEEVWLELLEQVTWPPTKSLEQLINLARKRV